MRRAVVSAVALCLWMGLMLVQGFTGLVRLPVSDKAQHFTEFGVLSLLVLANMGFVARRRQWTVATMAVACVLSEFMQAWLAQGRSFQWTDVMANCLGSACFLTVAWAREKWTSRVPDEGSYDELDVELDDIVV